MTSLLYSSDDYPKKNKKKNPRHTFGHRVSVKLFKVYMHSRALALPIETPEGMWTNTRPFRKVQDNGYYKSVTLDLVISSTNTSVAIANNTLYGTMHLMIKTQFPTVKFTTLIFINTMT